jgi:thiamine biosynthesis lipoprotein
MLDMPGPARPVPTSVQRFAAMGAEVVVGGATDTELTAIRRLFERRDRALGSRSADGELCWINRSDAPVVAVSALLAASLDDALRAARETGGIVDPTTTGAWTRLRLAGRMLRRPPGVELDLDDAVRGRTVDEAVGLIAGRGFVAAGADAATRTGAIVALPGGGRLHLRHGAVATASAAGAPGDEPAWDSVTVAAATCRDAGVAARAALGLGAAGPAWLDAHDLPGRFVAADGAVAKRHWSAAAGPQAVTPAVATASQHDPLDLPGELRP